MSYSTRKLIRAVVDGANGSLDFSWISPDTLELRIRVRHDDFPEDLRLPLERSLVEAFLLGMLGGMDAHERHEKRGEDG